MGKLLATGSTEAARAAARLAEDNSLATPAAEMHSSPGVAQPRSESPPSQGHRVDAVHDGSLDRNWSTRAHDGDVHADGFTDVAIDQVEPRLAEPASPYHHDRSSPRAASPPRSTLGAAQEVNRSRARSGSGSA